LVQKVRSHRQGDIVVVKTGVPCPITVGLIYSEHQKRGAHTESKACSQNQNIFEGNWREQRKTQGGTGANRGKNPTPFPVGTNFGLFQK